MKRILISIFIASVFFSCKKFLDTKPNDSWAVPSTIDDLQALLDGYTVLNTKFPVGSEELSDNYFLTSQELNTMSSNYINYYLWQKEDKISTSWAYEPLLTINSILEDFEKIAAGTTDQTKLNNVKGSALFFRAYYFYGIAQLFAPPYAKATADEKTGIPLRTNTDYNIASERSTLQQTYDKITDELKQAALLLPLVPSIKSRPSRPAAYGALARTYLAMGEYALAGQYADSCLKYENKLYDYNTISNLNARAIFTRFTNPEVVFHMKSQPIALLGSIAKVDSNLYKTYDNNDLRKAAFFRAQGTSGFFLFKGDYDGTGTGNYVFSGIVTDEMYLIRAEAYARAGNTTYALRDLNALLINRWRKNQFVARTAQNATEALGLILTERRKELLSRGARWVDMRRLKDDPQFGTIPKRFYNNQTYTLQPNSPRYTLQLPIAVIQNSNMEQNP